MNILLKILLLTIVGLSSPFAFSGSQHALYSNESLGISVCEDQGGFQSIIAENAEETILVKVDLRIKGKNFYTTNDKNILLTISSHEFHRSIVFTNTAGQEFPMEWIGTGHGDCFQRFGFKPKS